MNKIFQSTRGRALGLTAALFLFPACANHPLPVESSFNKGVELYDQGRYADAIEQYQLALRTNPRDTLTQYNLAVTYHDQGKHDEALKLYHEILQRTEDTNSRINIAAILMGRGEEAKAFAELETAARNNPHSAHPLSVWGEYLERKDQRETAHSLYDRALQADDKHAPTHHRLGRLLGKEGKNGDALAHLRRAVELDLEQPEYMETLGKEYERQGKTMEAVAMYERVTVYRTERDDLFVKLGDLYKIRKHYQEAVARYWMALAIRADNPHAHQSLKEIFQILADGENKWLEQNFSIAPLAKNPKNESGK
jgi:tetratricopeptide (TPR) repeat protein